MVTNITKWDRDLLCFFSSKRGLINFEYKYVHSKTKSKLNCNQISTNFVLIFNKRVVIVIPTFINV